MYYIHKGIKGQDTDPHVYEVIESLFLRTCKCFGALWSETRNVGLTCCLRCFDSSLKDVPEEFQWIKPVAELLSEIGNRGKDKNRRSRRQTVRESYRKAKGSETDRDTDAECAFHININQSGLCKWFRLCLCWHVSTVYPPKGWMAHCFPQSPSVRSLP